ncbi:MAG TPA: hypothetical protein VFB38_11135 [Chthonomonadaceae bacterium]|nr:hypothetical protein [Chthonomonadaceae bacterium]
MISLMMGGTGAMPAYEDAIADCSVTLLVTFFFGPLIGLVVYTIVGMIRQECNSALLTLLGLTIALPRFLGIAFASSADTFGLFALYGLFTFVSFFAVCVSFAGWFLSSFFRPINE